MRVASVLFCALPDHYLLLLSKFTLKQEVPMKSNFFSISTRCDTQKILYDEKVRSVITLPIKVVAQWDRASTPLGASFSVYVSSHLALA
jgi:hypothetical protein